MAEFDINESFVENLCVGKIAENLIFPYPTIKDEEKETLKSVCDSIDDFLGDKTEQFREWDNKAELPTEILNMMKEFGLFGVIIPEEHDGINLSTTGYSRTLQQLAHYDASIALTVGAHSSIGMKGLLLFGNDEQKKKYLPKLASGELLAAFCLTEAGSGSDAASIRTKAEKVDDGYILSGEKIWITNGGIADFFTVFATTSGSSGKISAFIVTRDMEGVSTGPHEDKMGIRASSTTTVVFDKVKLGKEHLLGEEGKGFKVAMNILNSGRTGLGGGCVGGMKSLIKMATEQASLREQFGKPIASFGIIKQKIGQMTIQCYVAESVVNMVSGIIDRGSNNYAVEAAISKVVATECLWRISDEAVQIAGGNGYMKEFPYERIMRDSRINRIFEGTNDILRLFIALTAMKSASTLLKDIGDLIQNPTKVFDDPIKGFGFFIEYSKRIVSSATGYGADRLTKVHEALTGEQQIIETYTRTVTQAADKLVRRHGKKIVDKQIACTRLANIIMDIFSLSCVVSRVSASIATKGEAKCEQELKIARIFGEQVTENIETWVGQIEDNSDEDIKSLADYCIKEKKFSWDNLT